MPICPICKFEYDYGQTECIDCGVALVDELPDEPDVEQEGIKFVPFRSYPSRLYAEMVKEALANEGIPSIIKTDQAYSFAEMGTSSTVSVVLWVADDSQELAETVADQMGSPK
jgi:hypothetical protein